MRIIAFGDSNTFGHGQFDCSNKHILNRAMRAANRHASAADRRDGPSLNTDIEPVVGNQRPSKFAWPFRLSLLANCKVINKGVPGASALLIAHTIRNFSYEPGDIVVVLWTYIARSTIFYDNNSFALIMPALLHKTAQKLYSILPDYDFHYKSICAMEHAHLWLHHRNINFNNWVVCNEASEFDYYRMGQNSATFMDFHMDKAPDEVHAGPLSQLLFAEHVYDKLCKDGHIVHT
jgi:hypothetical protein